MDEKEVSQSTCIKKNLNPEWNEEFNFSVKTNKEGITNQSFKIEVWDMNFGIFGKTTLSDFM
jgi:Ca2+-dependent lipid-binding protein